MVRLRNARTYPDVYIDGYEVRLRIDSLHGASMLPINRPLISSLFIATALLIAPFAHGQKSTDVLPAPLPAQIHNGKKVFISNAGGDSNYLYSGGPDRLYDQFYAALQSWGRYQLVTDPAEADLVFAVSFSNQFVGENGPTGNGSSQPLVGRSLTDPQFRLTILDPGTRVTLWTLTEHLEFAVLLGNRDKNFDQALAALVNDVKNIAGQPAATSPRR
jgi:hypothetical protein